MATYDRFRFVPTTSTSAGSNAVARESIARDRYSIALQNSVYPTWTDEDEEHLDALKKFRDSLAMNKSKHDELMEQFGQFYIGQNNPDDAVARRDAAKIMAAYFPQFSEDYYFKNFDEFMTQATGVKTDVKTFGDNVANIWNSAWASRSTAVDMANLYLSGFVNGFDNEEFQRNKQKVIERTKRNGQLYRKDLADNRFNSVLQKLIAGTVEQAPQIADSIIISAATGGLSLIADMASAPLAKAVGWSVEKVTETAKSLIKAGRATTSFVKMAHSEMGGTALSMAQEGFSDEAILWTSFAIGVATGLIEVPLEDAIFSPTNKMVDLILGSGDEAFLRGFMNIMKAHSKEIAKDFTSQILEEGLESAIGDAAYDIALSYEKAKGKMSDAEYKDFIEIVDNAMNAMGQAFWSTPGMVLGGQALSLGSEMAFGNIRKNFISGVYTDGENANANIPTANIAVRDINTDGIDLSALKKDKASPINAVRVGFKYFADNMDKKQAAAVKNSSQVYGIVDEDSVSFEAQHGETASKDLESATPLKEVVSFVDKADGEQKEIGAPVIDAQMAEKIIQTAYEEGELKSYSYVNKDGSFSQTNTGSAVQLVVEPAGENAGPVVIDITNGRNNAESAFGSDYASAMSQNNSKARNFAHRLQLEASASAVLETVFGITNPETSETYGQKERREKEAAKAKKKEDREKRKAERTKKNNESSKKEETDSSNTNSKPSPDGAQANTPPERTAQPTGNPNGNVQTPPVPNDNESRFSDGDDEHEPNDLRTPEVYKAMLNTNKAGVVHQARSWSNDFKLRKDTYTGDYKLIDANGNEVQAKDAKAVVLEKKDGAMYDIVKLSSNFSANSVVMLLTGQPINANSSVKAKDKATLSGATSTVAGVSSSTNSTATTRPLNPSGNGGTNGGIVSVDSSDLNNAKRNIQKAIEEKEKKTKKKSAAKKAENILVAAETLSVLNGKSVTENAASMTKSLASVTVNDVVSPEKIVSSLLTILTKKDSDISEICSKFYAGMSEDEARALFKKEAYEAIILGKPSANPLKNILFSGVLNGAKAIWINTRGEVQLGEQKRKALDKFFGVEESELDVESETGAEQVQSLADKQNVTGEANSKDASAKVAEQINKPKENNAGRTFSASEIATITRMMFGDKNIDLDSYIKSKFIDIVNDLSAEVGSKGADLLKMINDASGFDASRALAIQYDMVMYKIAGNSVDEDAVGFPEFDKFLEGIIKAYVLSSESMAKGKTNEQVAENLMDMAVRLADPFKKNWQNVLDKLIEKNSKGAERKIFIGGLGKVNVSSEELFYEHEPKRNKEEVLPDGTIVKWLDVPYEMGTSWAGFDKLDSDGEAVLEDFIPADAELFKVYPWLRNLKVFRGSKSMYVPMNVRSDVSEHYIVLKYDSEVLEEIDSAKERFKRIVKRGTLTEDMSRYGALLHEVQHAVDFFEGIAEGSIYKESASDTARTYFNVKDYYRGYALEKISNGGAVEHDNEFSEIMAFLSEINFGRKGSGLGVALKNSIIRLTGDMSDTEKFGAVSFERTPLSSFRVAVDENGNEYYDFDTTRMAVSIYKAQLANGKEGISLEAANLMANLLSSYGKEYKHNIVASYLAYHNGENIDLKGESRYDALITLFKQDDNPITPDGRRTGGKTLIDSSIIVLSPDAHQAVVPHESMHLVLWTSPSFRNKLISDLKTIMSGIDSESVNGEMLASDVMLRRYVEGHFSVFKDNIFKSVDDVMEALGAVLEDGYEFTDDRFERTEEAIIGLYESWLYDGDHKGLPSKLREIFEKIARLLKQVYCTVTGKEYMPELLDKDFASLFADSEDVSAFDMNVALSKNSTNKVRNRTLAYAVTADNLSETVARNISDIYLDNFIDVAKNAKKVTFKNPEASKIIRGFMNSNRKVYDIKDGNKLAALLDHEGFFEGVEAMAGKENAWKVKKAIAEDILFASQSYSVEANKIKNIMDKLEPLKDSNEKISTLRASNEGVIAAEDYLFGQAGLITEVEKLVNSDVNASKHRDRIYNAIGNRIQQSMQRTGRGEVKSELVGNLNAMLFNRLGKIGDNTTARELYNFFSLMVDDKGRPIVWLYKDNRTSRVSHVGEKYDGPLVALLNYAHSEGVLGKNGAFTTINGSHYEYVNENYARVSTRIASESGVSLIAEAGERRGTKIVLSRYMFDDNFRRLVSHLYDADEHGYVKLLGADSSLEYLTSIVDSYEEHISEVLEGIRENLAINEKLKSGEIDVSEVADELEETFRNMAQIIATNDKTLSEKFDKERADLVRRLTKAQKEYSRLERKLDELENLYEERTIENDKYVNSLVIEKRKKDLDKINKLKKEIERLKKLGPTNLRAFIDAFESNDDEEVTAIMEPLYREFKTMRDSFDTLNNEFKEFRDSKAKDIEDLRAEYEKISTDEGYRLSKDIHAEMTDLIEQLHSIADGERTNPIFEGHKAFTPNKKVAKAISSFVDAFSRKGTKENPKIGNLYDVFSKDFKAAFFIGGEESAKSKTRYDDSRRLYDFALSTGLLSKIDDERFVVKKTISNLSIAELGELVDIINEISDNAMAEWDERREARVRTRESQIEAIKAEAVAVGRDSKRRNIPLSDYIASVHQPSIGSNLSMDIKASLELPSLKCRNLLPESMSVILYGGTFTDEDGNVTYYKNDYNTLFNNEMKARRDRLDAFVNVVVDAMNESGFDKEITADNANIYMRRIFDGTRDKIGTMSYEQFAKRWGELYEERDYKVYVKAGLPPEVNAIAKFYAEIAARKAHLEKSNARLQKISDSIAIMEAAGIEVTQEEITAARDAEESIKKNNAEIAIIEATGKNSFSGEEEMSMDALMNIYLTMQQEGGLDKLLARPNSAKVDASGNYIFEFLQSDSNMFSIDNILWLMDKFLGAKDEALKDDAYYSKYKPFVKIADYMQSDLGSKFDDIEALNYKLTGDVMTQVDRYFTHMGDPSVMARYDSNVEQVSIDTFEKFIPGVGHKSTRDRQVHAKYPIKLGAVTTYMFNIANQEHYLAMAEKVKDMNSILEDGGQVFNAMKYGFGEKEGLAFFKQLKQMNENIAGVTNSNGVTAATKALSMLRNNSAASSLWMSITSSLVQFPTYYAVSDTVGAGFATRMFMEYTRAGAFSGLFRKGEASPLEEMIYEKSPQMKERARLQLYAYKTQRDSFSSLTDKIPYATVEAKNKVMDFGMKMLEWSDKNVANATWYCYYEYFKQAWASKYDGQLSAEEFDALCANEATQRTLDLSPNQSVKDNALLYTLANNDSLIKSALLFTNQSNKFLNKIFQPIQAAILRKDMDAWEVAKPIINTCIILMATPVINGFIFNRKRDDDEGLVEYLLRGVGDGFLSETIGLIPGAKDLKGAMTGKVYGDMNIFTAVGNLKYVIGKDKEDRTEHQLANAFANVVSESFELAGLPGAGVSKFYRAIREGNLAYVVNSDWANMPKNISRGE